MLNSKSFKTRKKTKNKNYYKNDSVLKIIIFKINNFLFKIIQKTATLTRSNECEQCCRKQYSGEEGNHAETDSAALRRADDFVRRHVVGGVLTFDIADIV